MTDQEKLDFLENMLVNNRVPILELVKIITIKDNHKELS
jgi:hypothetical protein